MPAQTRAKPALFDLAGRPLNLGSELGSGGEGAVYELRDRSDVVVKQYHKSLEPAKALKIATMAKIGNERLLKLTAWPTEPVRAGSGTGPIAGFMMPKITGHKQAFSLYLPKLRPQEFPKATWQFLIRSAANAARAFAVIHESGHVIGDVNHGNLFVGEQATVRLIDCDSYQIMSNGSRWLCEVGTPTHQPPELQNVRSYKGIIRSTNHDNFGLAVIIFQMLFMARHPFFGRFLGAGEMPMERAISEYRFAYGSNAAAMQMQAPPASVGLDGVTRNMALLFEQAFSRQGSQPNGRPTAREWAVALGDLEGHLKKCSLNPAHQFVDTLAKCPWCDIEAATGVLLFTVTLVGSAHPGFTITDFWGKVTSVPNPGSPPALPPIEGRTVTLSPAAMELQQASWGARFASGLFALVGGSSRIHVLKKDIDKKAADARSRWQDIQNNWTTYTNSKDFSEQLEQLQNLRTQYDALPQKRLQALQQLEANKYRLQVHAYLDACRIFHARIRGIGDARKAALQSYGIETAADITDQRVLAVPGFGPVALSNLKNWRNQQERRFRFNPNKGVDQADKDAVERTILTEKISLERKLNEGLSKLAVSSQHIVTRRRALLAQAEQAAGDLAQAEADLQCLIGHVADQAGKWVIAVIGAVTVGGLIIASQQSKGPAPSSLPTSQRTPIVATPSQKPSVPIQVTSVATTFPPARPTLPPHVEIDLKGQRRPEDGYDWSDVNRTNVRWIAGKLSQKNPHVIASDTEGKWEPEDGYDWINSDLLKDKSVRWASGTASSRYPHVVAALIKGQWRPADGFAWVVNPHRPDDMRVLPISTWLDQIISPSAPATPSPTPIASSFDQGRADRVDWEQWVVALTGDFRRGAEWWAGHRSLPSPGACNGPAAAMNQQFIFGCEAAKARLTPKDVKRKSDPDYRRGWNSYTDTTTPTAALDNHAPTVNQGTPAESTDADFGAIKRLNEQELRRLSGR
jgi:DNA-binding helix-hairpin-helix protein with protein kinase domain